MSHFNVQLAISYYEKLKKINSELFENFEKRLNLKKYYNLWNEKIKKLYLPKTQADGLLPQDDTYLSLPTIDIEKYKKSSTRADIIKDYNMEQLSELQVSKQADVLVLLNLKPSLISTELKKINFDYYESHCLHDSSLSLPTHCILANEIGASELAIKLLEDAQQIDLNNNPKTSEEGIHAASMAGLWQCVVNGFCGVRFLENGILNISPRMPKSWNKAKFNLCWNKLHINISITKDAIKIATKGILQGEIIICKSKEYKLVDNMVIYYNE